MTSGFMAKPAAVVEVLSRYVAIVDVAMEPDKDGLAVTVDGKFGLTGKVATFRQAHAQFVEAAGTVLDVVAGLGCELLYDCTRLTGYEADIRIMLKPPQWRSAEEIAAYVHIPG